MKKLLQEDDAAPDAREYFEKDFMKITGLTTFQFINIAEFKEVDDGMITQRDYNNYRLEISADYPFYKLYEIEGVVHE